MNSKKTPELSSPRLSLSVQYASAAHNLPTRAQLRRWIRSALQHDVSMTLRIVDEEEGCLLNKKFRGKDYATNVLTFVYDDVQIPPIRPPSTGSGQGSQEEEIIHGDVVICAPVVEQEAAAQHKELLAHYAHLAIHAALHLHGYEHENDSDAAQMEELETALMLELHYHDPYQAIANG